MIPKVAAHLIGIYGNASAVYSASRESLVEEGKLRDDIASIIAAKKFHKQAEAELEHCRKNNLVPVGVSSEIYPALLRECCDYPPVLYIMGNPKVLASDMLAVVGTRKISPYGAAMCERIVGGLTGIEPQLAVVSGLAYGVDSASHRAAIAAGLTTVAVMGNKLPRIYPSDHTALANRIIETGGALVSELHSQAYEGKANFVARNRLIAGMSRGTLIVESPQKGGSMITAEMASGYDRVVMAVPGRVTDENSSGTNRLICSMKAVAICDGAHVVSELGYEKSRSRRDLKANVGYEPTGDPLMDLIAGAENGATADYISDKTGMPASEVLSSLFNLEMDGKIRKAPGGLYFKI
ncbi:MAG: DNA-processing protein DprA [Alistipes sp.]|nr:DNA-processing protein DprA [Alistipes sp.]